MNVNSRKNILLSFKGRLIYQKLFPTEKCTYIISILILLYSKQRQSISLADMGYNFYILHLSNCERPKFFYALQIKKRGTYQILGHPLVMITRLEFARI